MVMIKKKIKKIINIRKINWRKYINKYDYY